MAIDWAGGAKWLGPPLVAFARKLLAERDATALQRSRDEHAAAAATEISRMILSGYTPADTNLHNLIAEFEELLSKGARLPRDLRTTVETLIGRAKIAQYAEGRQDHQLGGGAHPKQATGRFIAKKAAAKRPASKKAAAKRPASKKATAKRPAAKKAARNYP